MQAQVANRPRHNHATRRERADLRLPSTAEAHSPAAIFLRVLADGHVYKIVRWEVSLEVSDRLAIDPSWGGL
jgi:hypothetical protein